jgi:hypothetical protein
MHKDGLKKIPPMTAFKTTKLLKLADLPSTKKKKTLAGVLVLGRVKMRSVTELNSCQETHLS